MNIVEFFKNKGYLVSEDFLNTIDDTFNPEKFMDDLLKEKEKPVVLTKDVYRKIIDKKFEEKTKKCEADTSTNILTSVKIVKNYEEQSKKREVQHFVSYFKERYNFLKDVLQKRPELENTVSINRVIKKSERENVSIIGLVNEKRTTKNGNIIVELEDPTGKISIIVTKNKEEFDKAKDLVLDEVIGVTGVMANRKMVFANKIFFPDIPQGRGLKKCPDEVYAVFTSDLHIGSKMFLEKNFSKFIKWLNCELGDEKQREIAKKVKYLFIVGDLVDGINIYPNQEKELEIKDVEEQYNACAEYLSQIRDDISIILCGGNHDALRLTEPQPKLNKKFAKRIYDLKNVLVVSNPAMVNIHSSENFKGFDVLLYHGFSFDYYVANVDSIRNNGGYDRADLIMKFLLQRRHLAPAHSSTLYIPDPNKDPLVIDKTPDFFVAGHIHKSKVGSYKSTTTICCSCWQAKTTFQERVGHNPEPARVPIVNLKTRQTKILKFE